ncbi:MAG: FAD-dependent oxidoreductase [Marinilabiliales bacterium]|nr:FAD-dependent oxidoreductase [Marinilabiliales bacterium]
MKIGTNRWMWLGLTVVLLALGISRPSASMAGKKGSYQADLIIYGGTSAAVIAAVEATHSGLHVIVVSPDAHMGGLTSGGLGFTDTGNKSVIGGLARDFYHRIWQHYNDSTAWNWEKRSDFGNRGQGTVAMDGENRTMWIFEPHVAEQVFEELIRENHLTIFRQECLNRKSGIIRKGSQIISFSTLSGKCFKGRIFIDATYEGDLMAAAGVPYTIGREGNARYGETYNGVQADIKERGHFFKTDIDPYQVPGVKESGLLYGISPEPIAVNGSGDKKVQAYCFRLCMTDKPENRMPFPKPEKYNPSDYELVARVLDTGWMDWFAKYDRIPNRKTDTNNHGPFSSDFIGGNYDYPEASYEARKEIIQAHEHYQKGLLYFLSNDPRVSSSVREKMKQWGLAADEFKDNGNWPHQLYIREARRMLGVFVTTELEVTGQKEVPQSIGMGSYGMDSHNVQRYVNAAGKVQNEGDVQVHLKAPYSISYGSILPKREDCTNLLVPVCVSASHIAYGSIRMEPVFMILGQSAVVAAEIALKKKIALQDVPYPELEKALKARHQIMRLDAGH